MKQPQEKKKSRISYYLAMPCSVYEQSMYCCVWLNFPSEVSFFIKPIGGDSREHWSATGGREEHRLSL